jgi:hypothetical protein
MFEVSCPSGLRGVLRGMKVKDEQLFTDRKLVKAGRVISAILDACWLETRDPGPYMINGTKPDWGNLLSADRTYLLLQLRIASYGEKYDFRVTCGACRHHFVWTVDLTQLDVKPVSNEGRQHVKSNEPLLVPLPDGRHIKCRLLTGADEEFFANLAGKDESKFLTYHLARRIVEVDGKTHWRDVLAVVEDFEAKQADHLWNVTDELEGGVDTMFDIECPSCFKAQQVVLPFEAGFFSSRKRFANLPQSENG